MMKFPPYAILFPPAARAKIDFAGAMLKNDGFAEIPDEYAEFLMQSDGAISADAEFYGAEPHARKGFAYPSIVEANRPMAQSGCAAARGSVMLGAVLEGALFFEPGGGIVLRSRFSLAHLAKFETFGKAVEELCLKSIP
jgi:hypothetical protein